MEMKDKEAQTSGTYVESLDLEARGVAKQDGKVIFIDGALPGETVQYSSYRKKPSYEFAQLTEIKRSSSVRISPRCPHFGVCGGCSMQHLDPVAQLAVKQRVLEDNLWHIAKVKPDMMLRPIQGPDWRYRYRARLSVRYVAKKGGVLVGFHEKKSSYVADMRECHVLPKAISDLLLPLRSLVESLSIRERLPQIEYAQGQFVTVMVLRVLEAPSSQDQALLRQFAEQHQVQFWLQPQGPDSAVPFWPVNAPELSYALGEFGLHMPFKPTDFTQVNHQINQSLVSYALRLLQVQSIDRVLDLFCGLGNFTLPLATQARQVHGIEGSETLVQRALDNAQRNGLNNASFAARNLFETTPEEMASWGAFDRVLIDPPREGALAVAQALASEQVPRPKRLVYVSCNPATLARDAAVLTHEGGWKLSAAGVVNMFPHTSHVESIAVFDA
ncbi:MAG: 23S rRNA (uracil(1939)-C(5))-methyltransferase RlmD [Burkholderiales bacterium]